MVASRSTVRDLRRRNRRVVLERIYVNGQISRLAVSGQTGLSAATVANVVAELLAEGIVAGAGSEESEGGRPRTILAINPAHGCFVGVDVGETLVSVELFDLTLRSLRTFTHPLHANDNCPDNVVRYIVAGLDTVLADAAIPADNVVGVGVGVPGIVERAGSVHVRAPSWGWRAVPLMAMLDKEINLPIVLDNGAKAMAQAELWFGAGRGADDLVVLLIGTGIGAGIITQGALYRGATNGAGEWGHTTLTLDGRPCRCGSRGCLEAYAGAAGIMTSLREAAPRSTLLNDDDQEGTILALATAAGQGDPIAVRVLEDTTHYLGAGIANLINLVNPRRLVLGGWVGQQIGPYILPRLREIVARYALEQPLRAATVVLGQLGPNAVAKGAATLALDVFLTEAGDDRRRPSRRAMARVTA
ncbi:MAG: family transcriptional regulator [Chloroflexi bacterium]|nr:family transcriptional regulator [Chloroflexota bacterium]